MVNFFFNYSLTPVDIDFIIPSLAFSPVLFCTWETDFLSSHRFLTSGLSEYDLTYSSNQISSYFCYLWCLGSMLAVHGNLYTKVVPATWNDLINENEIFVRNDVRRKKVFFPLLSNKLGLLKLFDRRETIPTNHCFISLRIFIIFLFWFTYSNHLIYLKLLFGDWSDRPNYFLFITISTL